MLIIPLTPIKDIDSFPLIFPLDMSTCILAPAIRRFSRDWVKESTFFFAPEADSPICLTSSVTDFGASCLDTFLIDSLNLLIS